MSQPPQPPDPRRPQDPQDRAGQQPQHGTGAGKGPIVAIVGCALLVFVLVVSLVAYFGVRALTSIDEQDATVAEETTEPAAEGGHVVSADALPAEEAVIEGQWVAAT